MSGSLQWMLWLALCGADPTLPVADETSPLQIVADEQEPEIGVPEVTASTPATGAAIPAPADKGPAEPKKPAPPPKPYKILLFDNDFSYLCKPGTCRDDYYEWTKLKCACPKLVYSVGGQFRHQFKNENRRSLFTGVISNPRTDTFNLTRTRLYGDFTYDRWLRGYVEGIDAVSMHQDLPALPIDINRYDLLNAFVDVSLLQTDDGVNTTIRAGRQELLFGDQRLVSPLDWANTRRTFEGLRLLNRGSEHWDFDAFWTRPTTLDLFIPGRITAQSFDQANQATWFAGAFGQSRGYKYGNFMPYIIALRQADPLPGPAIGRGHRIFSATSNNFVYTIGNQFKGERNDWLYDFEAAIQTGRSGRMDILAGMTTLGVGRRWSENRMKPTVWMWYDYASGDNDPTDGTLSTFNQIFPLQHKYFGFIDLVARQNVHDINFQFFLNPSSKLTLMAWTHFMFLASAKDGLYNAGAITSFQDPTGSSGKEIGTTIDFTATYNYNSAIYFQVGYSPWWSGGFVRTLGGQELAHLFYTELGVHF